MLVMVELFMPSVTVIAWRSCPTLTCCGAYVKEAGICNKG